MAKVIEYTEKYREGLIELLINVIIRELELGEKEMDIINHNYNIYKQSGGNFWIVIDDNDKVIGSIGILKTETGREVKLTRLYLDKEYRGVGVSKEMLNVVIEFVKNVGAEKIILGTYKKLERAINFYKKYGFIEISNDDTGGLERVYYALEV